MQPKTMSQTDMLRAAFLRGHFWNPAKPDVLNVDASSVGKLTVDHPIAKQAFASWQEADINLDTLVWAFHGRESILDGGIGPATERLIAIPRCSLPDHPPPAGAAFDYGDPDLNKAVESYQEFAASFGGAGSWPLPGCDPQRTDVHSTVVRITTGGFSAHQKGLLKEITALVEKCEGEMGQAVRHVFDDNTTKAQHDVRGGFLAGGTIGYAYFPTPGTCNQLVRATIDNSFNASAITLANLFDHEYKGHSDGLNHTRGGIMNPSIITINPLSWKGDPSEGTKKRYFGGVPIKPIDRPFDNLLI